MIAGSLLSQVIPEGVASDEQTVSNGRPSKSSDYPSGGRHVSWGRRRELYHIDVTEAGQPCLQSPLWNTEVDPLNYEFGCTDIEVRTPECLTAGLPLFRSSPEEQRRHMLI